MPCSSQNDGPRTREIIKNIIVEKPQLLSECMLECDNGKCFRNNSMPLLLSLNPQPFLNFACGLVNSFHVSQREVQSTLRNQLGKSLSEVLGVNIIPSKRDILHELKVQKEEILDQVELQFNEFKGIVCGHVNIKAYIELLLNQPMFDIDKLAPLNKIIIYGYPDLAPFLKWSWHFNGLTSYRLKIVDVSIMHCLAITAAIYLGEDSYDNLKNAFKPIYEELHKLGFVNVQGERLDVLSRSVADGKQRRLDMGLSSARSSYPFVEAPEHKTQMGDMRVTCSKPVTTLTNVDQYQNWLKERKDNDNNRQVFSKTHLGSMGRENISCKSPEEYYPGALHLAMRSAETLSLYQQMC